MTPLLQLLSFWGGPVVVKEIHVHSQALAKKVTFQTMQAVKNLLSSLSDILEFILWHSLLIFSIEKWNTDSVEEFLDERLAKQTVDIV